MKTPHAIRRLVGQGRLPVLSGLSCFAMLVLGGAGPSPVAAADWALRFNGSAQYVQVPLGETVVMDNDGPRFLTAPDDAWITATATNAWQVGSRQTINLAATARWTPLLPRGGAYKVYAWWGGSNQPLDTNAQYVVKHAGNDQRPNGRGVCVRGEQPPGSAGNGRRLRAGNRGNPVARREHESSRAKREPGNVPGKRRPAGLNQPTTVRL